MTLFAWFLRSVERSVKLIPVHVVAVFGAFIGGAIGGGFAHRGQLNWPLAIGVCLGYFVGWRVGLRMFFGRK
jgi:uncharacterized membrane protein YfcA